MLDEARTGLRRFKIVNQRVLRNCQLDAIRDRLLLSLELDGVAHHAVLQEVHVPLLILRKLLNEALEGLSRLCLRRLGATAEELCDTILQYLVDEVLIAEGFLLLRVLANDTHDLTETVRVIYGHLDSRQWLSLVE